MYIKIDINKTWCLYYFFVWLLTILCVCWIDLATRANMFILFNDKIYICSIVFNKYNMIYTFVLIYFFYISFCQSQRPSPFIHFLQSIFMWLELLCVKARGGNVFEKNKLKFKYNHYWYDTGNNIYYIMLSINVCLENIMVLYPFYPYFTL